MKQSEETPAGAGVTEGLGKASEDMTIRLAGEVGACVTGWLDSRLTDLRAVWLTD